MKQEIKKLKEISVEIDNEGKITGNITFQHVDFDENCSLWLKVDTKNNHDGSLSWTSIIFKNASHIIVSQNNISRKLLEEIWIRLDNIVKEFNQKNEDQFDKNIYFDI